MQQDEAFHNASFALVSIDFLAFGENSPFPGESKNETLYSWEFNTPTT